MIYVNDIQGKYLDDIPQQVADATLTPNGKLCLQRNIRISYQKQTPFPYAKLHFRQHHLGPSFDGLFSFICLIFALPRPKFNPIFRLLYLSFISITLIFSLFTPTLLTPSFF